ARGKEARKRRALERGKSHKARIRFPGGAYPVGAQCRTRRLDSAKARHTHPETALLNPAIGFWRDGRGWPTLTHSRLADPMRPIRLLNNDRRGPAIRSRVPGRTSVAGVPFRACVARVAGVSLV